MGISTALPSLKVRKFGRNALIGATFAPVTTGAIYRMPLPAGATTLRIKAGGNVADTAAGAGAREITLEGLCEQGRFVSETLATAGASASAVTTTTFMRLFRIYVSASGTHADGVTTFSHAAAILVEDGAGTEVWGSIIASPSRGQSLIGCFTTPITHAARFLDYTFSSDTNKLPNHAMFTRGGIMTTSAPFEAIRTKREFSGVPGIHSVIEVHERQDAIAPGTDLLWMAQVAASTVDVSVSFELELLPVNI